VVTTSTGSATYTKGYEYTYFRGNNIEEVAQIGGWTGAVTAEGNYAYIQQGSTLTILNIMNPANPTFVGKIRLPDAILGIAVSGNLAYVADSDMGLVVVDISDRTNPSIRGYHDTPGKAVGVKVMGGYAYVLDAGVDGIPHSLRVYNVIEPTAVDFVSSVVLGAQPWDSCLALRSGKVFCYVARNGGMDVVEVTNPASPILRGHYNTSGVSYGIAIKGDYVYLGEENPESSFYVINIADPQNPSFCGKPSGGWWCWNGLTVSNDNRVYIAGAGKIKSFDVSNPSAPRIVQGGDVEQDIIGGQMVLRGSNIFSASGSYGMASISISDPDRPTKVGSFKSALGYLNGVHVFNGYAYAAYLNDGFRVIDVHDPTNPTFRGEYTGVRILGMSDHNGYLYAAGDGSKGIQCFDVSNPNAITLKAVSDVSLQYFGWGLAEKEGILYSAGSSTNEVPYPRGCMFLILLTHCLSSIRTAAIVQAISVPEKLRLVALLHVYLTGMRAAFSFLI